MNAMMFWRALLLCLAVLLPWRSTLAVTMVMAPMAHHSASAQLDKAPCPHHASANEHGSGHEDMTDHTACDVCHVPALSADLRSASQAHAHPIEPPPLSERFDSVVVAQHHKPPISA